jgi:hypothetical protein
MPTKNLVTQIVPSDWDSPVPVAKGGQMGTQGGSGSGAPRTRWLQSTADLLNRPVINRGTASTSATAVATNGGPQSTGIGTGPLTPQRYGEFTVKARVSYNVNDNVAYHYVYRTTGAIPANGAAPNAGDVIVGGDAFAGGTVASGVGQVGTFSYLDSELSPTTPYRYYLAVNGNPGKTVNLTNDSQLLVMERS